MSNTLWKPLGAHWIDDDPDNSMIVVPLQSEGKYYAVVCSGPKDMKAPAIVDALRAATATLLRAMGADMTAVGASAFNAPVFDTGDQRPS